MEGQALREPQELREPQGLQLELVDGVSSDSGVPITIEYGDYDEDEEEMEETENVESRKSPIKPSLKETYAILLDSEKSTPFIAEVIDINEPDQTITFRSSKKTYHFVLKHDELPLSTNNILDIERVIPFDVSILKEDLDQVAKQLTSDIIQELDISLEEIKSKDIIYTEVEYREDLLSKLVEGYDAYDNLSSIKSIQSTITQLLELVYSTTADTIYLYNVQRDKPFPKWLAPLTDNPMKLRESMEQLSSTYTQLQSQSNISLNTIINEQMNEFRPIEPSLSERGYVVPGDSGIISTYYRECFLTDSCIGIRGNYRYDQRKNKLPYYRYFDGSEELVVSSDTLNVTGFLVIPDVHLRFGLSICDTTLTMNEKTVLDSVANKHIHSLKYAPVIQDIPEDVSSDMSRLRLHQIPNRLQTKNELYELLEGMIPSVSDLIGSVDESLRQKILNYHDFQTLTVQYDINPYKLSAEELLTLNELVKTNVSLYLKQNESLPSIVVNNVLPTLSLDQKIRFSLSTILDMIDIPRRNEYLQKFIQLFTRDALSTEQNGWLYNIYTNERLLCKHYLYSSVYHKDPKAHQTMITIYGNVPEDGCIYCKHCGEYLCDEDFSEFDGFSDERPIMMREEIVDTTSPLDPFKEEDISLVTLLGSALGVKIKESDIAIALDIFKPLNNDIIANKRYDTVNISTSDEHPLVKDILKRHSKQKNKKQLIAKDVKQFQSYLKQTNKILVLVSLLLLLIYSDIPGYNTKQTRKFQLIQFDGSYSVSSLQLNRITIDATIQKLNHLKYQSPEWMSYRDLMKEHKTYSLPTIREQLLHLMDYFISPNFPVIQDRLTNYGKYIQSTLSKYINYEWALFKPLQLGDISVKVNELLQSKDAEYKPHYLLNYVNYPVENVSLLTQLMKSYDEPIYKLVGLHVSEIMVNQSFLRMFALSMSNYGTYKGVHHLLDLVIDRFIQTTQKSDQVKEVFKQHQWRSSLESGKVNFKNLRTKIIPDIIRLYLKTEGAIQTCYSDELACNEFLHMNINNYNLHLFQTEPKRFYQYIPFVVYPVGDFEDMTDEFKQRVFARYCKDPSGKVCKRSLSLNYLGELLLKTDMTIEDDYIRFYEQELKLDASNFKDILQAIQEPLEPSMYVKPRLYTIDDYVKDIVTLYSHDELKLSQVFRDNDNFDLESDNPLIRTLDQYTELLQIKPIQFKEKQRELFNQLSHLDTSPFVEIISGFIGSTSNAYVKRRYETIFVNTTSNINISDEDRQFLEQTESFRYRNMKESDIRATLDLFLQGSSFQPAQCIHYLNQLKQLLAILSSTTQPCTNVSSKDLTKCWRMNTYSLELFETYKLTSALNIHQDMFRRDPKYVGFSKYKQPAVFLALFEFIQPYMNKLYKMKAKQTSLLDETVEVLLHRFLFVFTLQKMISFHERLQQEDEEVISSINQNLLSHPQRETYSHLESVDLVEQFIMDYIIHIFESHYDSRWVVSNQEKDNLKQRLSKQKEKEKQQLIHELDQMSDEKRASTVELQKIGVVSMYHQAMAANQSRIMDEYSAVDEDFEAPDVEDEPVEPDEITGDQFQQEGYFGIDDIDEDGQMGDELHEFNDEDLLDNAFNQ